MKLAEKYVDQKWEGFESWDFHPEPSSFRPYDRLPASPWGNEMLERNARAIWMQEGVFHEEAARRAEEAGIQVAMDRCILKDHRRLAQAS